MRDPDETRADDALPLPPRPDAEVLVPPRRASELRRELRRLEGEREGAQRELGELVVEMSHAGALSPALLADRSAAVRSLEQQIDALTTALGGRRPPAAASTRRATALAALLAVAVAGGVAGAWIQHAQDDPAAVPVTVPTVVTQTVTQNVTLPAVTTRTRTAAVQATRGGRAETRTP